MRLQHRPHLPRAEPARAPLAGWQGAAAPWGTAVTMLLPDPEATIQCCVLDEKGRRAGERKGLL